MEGPVLGPLDPLADGVVADPQPPRDRTDGVALGDNLLDRTLLKLFRIDLPAHRDTPWPGHL